MHPVALTRAVLVTLCLIVAGGCGWRGGHEADPGLPASAVASAAPRTADQPLPRQADLLDASFDEMAAVIPGVIGVAVATATGVRSFGKWTAGPAWSTIKVPLAIAALRRSDDDAAPLVERAITQSDNQAAEQLWSQLGSPVDAAAAVAAVLRDGGDKTTSIQSVRTRPEFTAFGQSNWALTDQATFAAHLPCLRASAVVLEGMRNLVPAQQWGFGARNDSGAKGGWGPAIDGRYLVRQIAVLTTGSGTVGVAVAAAPTDGTFQSGVDGVDALTEWVGNHVQSFPGTQCEPSGTGISGGPR